MLNNTDDFNIISVRESDIHHYPFSSPEGCAQDGYCADGYNVSGMSSNPILIELKCCTYSTIQRVVKFGYEICVNNKPIYKNDIDLGHSRVGWIGTDGGPDYGMKTDKECHELLTQTYNKPWNPAFVLLGEDFVLVTTPEDAYDQFIIPSVVINIRSRKCTILTDLQEHELIKKYNIGECSGRDVRMLKPTTQLSGTPDITINMTSMVRICKTQSGLPYKPSLHIVTDPIVAFIVTVHDPRLNTSLALLFRDDGTMVYDGVTFVRKLRSSLGIPENSRTRAFGKSLPFYADPIFMQKGVYSVCSPMTFSELKKVAEENTYAKNIVYALIEHMSMFGQ